jgi:hypothetical protein
LRQEIVGQLVICHRNGESRGIVTDGQAEQDDLRDWQTDDKSHHLRERNSVSNKARQLKARATHAKVAQHPQEILLEKNN